MRELKFRGWNRIVDRMSDPVLISKFPANTQWQNLVIMQSTGLNDKTGKEIFEGDVIRLQVNQHIWFYQIGCVEADGANLYAINIRDNVTIDNETDTYTYQMTDVRAGLSHPIPAGCEVVGNIYENPELMAL